MPYLNMNGLFAGMESMLEGDVEINNNVTAPDAESPAAINDAIEDENTAAEGTEIEKDAEQEATEAEMIAAGLKQACNMYDHVKKFGVDRSFLSLYNSDGGLSMMIGAKFPACESMDAVGDPSSSYSRAFIEAMESGDGLWEKFTNFLRKIADHVRDFFRKIWDWLAESFGSITRKIGSLRKAVKESTLKSDDKRKDKKANLYDLGKLDEAKKALTEHADKSITKISGNVKNNANDILAAVKNYADQGPSAIYGDSVSAFGYNSDKKKFKDDVLKPLEDEVKDLVKKVKDLSRKDEDFDKKYTNLDSWLASAEALVNLNYKWKDSLKIFNTSGDMLKAAAQRASQMQTGESLSSESLRNISSEASQISKQTSLMGKVCAACPKLASMYCKNTAEVLSAWYESKSMGTNVTAADNRKPN